MLWCCDAEWDFYERRPLSGSLTIRDSDFQYHLQSSQETCVCIIYIGRKDGEENEG